MIDTTDGGKAVYIINVKDPSNPLHYAIVYKDTTWYSSYKAGSYRSGVIKYNNQTLYYLYVEPTSVYIAATTISTTSITKLNDT